MNITTEHATKEELERRARRRLEELVSEVVAPYLRLRESYSEFAIPFFRLFECFQACSAAVFMPLLSHVNVCRHLFECVSMRSSWEPSVKLW